MTTDEIMMDGRLADVCPMLLQNPGRSMCKDGQLDVRMDGCAGQMDVRMDACAGQMDVSLDGCDGHNRRCTGNRLPCVQRSFKIPVDE